MPKWNDSYAISAADDEFNLILRRLEELEAAERQAAVTATQWNEWRRLSKAEQRDLWLENRVRPQAQEFGVSASGAERLAARWLEFLGEEEVTITQRSGDGGVDVVTTQFCCQVKNYENQPVAVSTTREIFGVATSHGLSAMLFTSSNLTAEAKIFCEANNIIAIQFDAYRGNLSPLTDSARQFLNSCEYVD